MKVKSKSAIWTPNLEFLCKKHRFARSKPYFRLTLLFRPANFLSELLAFLPTPVTTRIKSCGSGWPTLSPLAPAACRGRLMTLIPPRSPARKKPTANLHASCSFSPTLHASFFWFGLFSRFAPIVRVQYQDHLWALLPSECSLGCLVTVLSSNSY